MEAEEEMEEKDTEEKLVEQEEEVVELEELEGLVTEPCTPNAPPPQGKTPLFQLRPDALRIKLY